MNCLKRFYKCHEKIHIDIFGLFRFYYFHGTYTTVSDHKKYMHRPVANSIP